LKSAQLIIKLLQECNKKGEIKPNDVDNCTNSDQNKSEIVSNKWCYTSSKSYNKAKKKKTTDFPNKPTMQTSNKFSVLSEEQTQATVVQWHQPCYSAPSKHIKKSHTKTHKIYLTGDSHITNCSTTFAITLVAHMVFLKSQNPMLSQMQLLLQ
jgi:hypothetical protein